MDDRLVHQHLVMTTTTTAIVLVASRRLMFIDFCVWRQKTNRRTTWAELWEQKQCKYRKLWHAKHLFSNFLFLLLFRTQYSLWHRWFCFDLIFTIWFSSFLRSLLTIIAASSSCVCYSCFRWLKIKLILIAAIMQTNRKLISSILRWHILCSCREVVVHKRDQLVQIIQWASDKSTNSLLVLSHAIEISLFLKLNWIEPMFGW